MSIYFSPYLHFIRNLAHTLPGVTEKLCFDTPAFYAGGKLFARLKEDGETLAINTEERDKWMGAEPETFFITDHYLNAKYMLINLGLIDQPTLTQLLVQAWKNRASKKLLKMYDEQATEG